MTIASANTLGRRLKPLCPRDNHVMKYESGRTRANIGDHSSYHCGYVGCSVRYNSDQGYYTLMGTPSHTYDVDEPGVNTLKCPRHEHWLYRQENSDAKLGARWRCGVEGCDYVYDASTKGDWVRT